VTSGDPKDLIIELSNEGCDPFDSDCDAICSFEDNRVCDPKCYVDGTKEDVKCDIDCVDKNGNHVIDAGDIDGICDLDCYNDDLDQNMLMTRTASSSAVKTASAIQTPRA